MCGIAGYMRLLPELPAVEHTYLTHMEQALAHRGPDGHGVWIAKNGDYGLAHRRLSIVDVSSAGAQPMLDAEHTVAISFNGEIYNHRALRTELEQLGYRYNSNTDTETIIYAYKAWGIQSINRFEGMFAFALLDLVRDELFVVRDRMGIKPVYFTLQGNYFSCASEIKALLVLPWVQKKINTQALSQYLTILAAAAPLTLYDQIYKLPASFYAKISKNRDLTFHEWYSPIQPITIQEQDILGHEHTSSAHVLMLLRCAVKKRLMADVPLGVFLSGGVDSSLIVALMAEITDTIQTFNVSFSDGPEHNETIWARYVADRYHTDHHELVISEKEAFEFFESMVYHQDEPLGNSDSIPLYYVAQLLKSCGVTVALVGDGADELFCGYTSYARYVTLATAYTQTQKYIPNFARRAVFNVLRPLLRRKINYSDTLNNWSRNKSFFCAGAIGFPELFKQEFKVASDDNYDPILEKIYAGMSTIHDSYVFMDYHAASHKKIDQNADFFKTMTYRELKHRLPELLLMRVDKMTMAAGVEGRVPFLDHHLVEFALKIPQQYKYKNNIPKYILKKIAEDFLPHELLYRKKIGFASPTARWFKSGTYFRPYFCDLLSTKRAALGEYMDVAAIERLYQYNQTTHQYTDQLWVLQNFLALDLI